ncbi:MAG: hypothetical protein QM723_05240 [Myxococcaceae bacterium]
MNGGIYPPNSAEQHSASQPFQAVGGSPCSGEHGSAPVTRGKGEKQAVEALAASLRAYEATGDREQLERDLVAVLERLRGGR